MIEIVRQVAGWLAGTVTDYQAAAAGLGAQLAALSYDGTDTAPATPTVTSEVGDDVTARREVPDALPACTVHVMQEDSDAGWVTGQVETRLTLLIRFAMADPDSADAVRDQHYYFRAARKSLRQLHRPENEAKRTRNGIQWYHDARTPMQVREVSPQREDDRVTRALLVTYIAREIET